MLEGKYATLRSTPQKTNMPSENQWLENVFPIETFPFFKGRISFRECRNILCWQSSCTYEWMREDFIDNSIKKSCFEDAPF